MAQVVLFAAKAEIRSQWRAAFSTGPAPRYVLLETDPNSSEFQEYLQLAPDVLVLGQPESDALTQVTAICPVLICGSPECSTIPDLQRTLGTLLATSANRAPVSVAGIVADPRSRRVSSNGASIRLTNHEFVILDRLMRNAGRVVPRSVLLEGLQNSGRALEVHISRLRKKLGGSRNVIQSIRKAGYLFVDTPAENPL
jgi:hypothetical protein